MIEQRIRLVVEQALAAEERFEHRLQEVSHRDVVLEVFGQMKAEFRKELALCARRAAKRTTGTTWHDIQEAVRSEVYEALTRLSRATDDIADKAEADSL